jgi:putative endonuclease
MDPGLAIKHRALARGRRGETVCAWWLRLKGYRILARNLKTPQGEIDILARRGRTVAVVEVKSRDEVAVAGESVTRDKRRRLLRAARYVLARFPEESGISIRFDAMLVAGWRVEHVMDAWREEAG